MVWMQFALNKEAMRGKQRLSGVAISAISALFVATVFLSIQNHYYRNANRQLILQNDSILSVNIHLQDTLKNEVGISFSNKNAKTN